MGNWNIQAESQLSTPEPRKRATLIAVKLILYQFSAQPPCSLKQLIQFCPMAGNQKLTQIFPVTVGAFEGSCFWSPPKRIDTQVSKKVSIISRIPYRNQMMRVLLVWLGLGWKKSYKSSSPSSLLPNSLLRMMFQNHPARNHDNLVTKPNTFHHLSSPLTLKLPTPRMGRRRCLWTRVWTFGCSACISWDIFSCRCVEETSRT